MAQFAILARDFPDGIARRLESRDLHVQLGDRLVAEGKLVFGAAIMNAEGQMTGSILVGNFSDRTEIDGWLKEEPYVNNRVWEHIEILPIRIGPSFAKLFPSLT